MDPKENKNEAAMWQQRFQNRQNKMKRIFDDAKKYYDIMYAVNSKKGIDPWKSKVYLPILASKGWDLISRMSDVVPLFTVKMKNELELDDETGQFTKPEATRQRELRIEAKLQEDYDGCAHDEPMKLRVFDPLVDAVVAGTGYAVAPWVFKEKSSYGRMSDSMGTMDNQNTVVKKTKEGYNDFQGINFFNVFPADGPSFYKIPYLIVRGYEPLVDMKATGIYENLDKVKTIIDDQDFRLYNEARNRVVNEDEVTWKDDSVKTVTYYECYERTEKGVKLTTFAEGEDKKGESSWVMIRKPSYPYWHNMFPVVPFYCRKKSYSPLGESLFENNRTLQSATNDLFNHYLDNWNLSIDGMIMYEDGSLTNDYIVEPGGELTYTGEAPKQFKFPEPNPQQLSVVLGVIEKGVENATFSQYASGVPNSAADKTQGTAYGIKSITEAATTKIGFFRDNFKQSMKTLGRIWLSNLQQFSNTPQEITRTVNGRQQPDVIVPSDYQGEPELDIDDDSMTPMSKQDKRDMSTQFTQELLTIQEAAIKQSQIFGEISDIPRFNFHEISDDKAQLYSVKDYDRYILPSQAQPKPEPQPEFKDTPEGIVLDNVSKKYDKAAPDIKAQLEEAAGLQPSGMHDSQMAHDAIKMGAEQAQIENQPVQGEMDGTQDTGTAEGGAPSPAQGSDNSGAVL